LSQGKNQLPAQEENAFTNVQREITDGALFSLFLFALCLCIKKQQGGAPEMVARKLNRMIMEHPTLLQNKASGSSMGGGGGGSNSYTRPLLVILDRNADLMTPVQHCSTYQALIDDVLIHHANRVEFEMVPDPSQPASKKAKPPMGKKYDVDPDLDPFYSSHKFVPFPDAIEQNDTELREVTQREQAIRSKATNAPSTIPAADASSLYGASDLATAVDSLPALIERKKQLEVHTSILQAVMNEVAARDVPQFYDIESSLATGSYRNDLGKAKKDVMALISDNSKGNVYDKIRLIIVYALATGAKTSDIDEVTTAFQQVMESKVVDDKTIGPKVECSIKAIHYIKQLRSMHMIPSASDMIQELQSTKSKSNESSTMFSSLMAKATTQATGFLAKASDRVSSMLGKIHKHHTTVVLENLCDMRPNTEDESYLYLDPKVKGDVQIAQLQSVITRPPVRDAIAFMIGGGCYSEYQNLQMIAHERRTITYGCTELLDPDSFVQQLGQLG
jgi:sec1 family domain-containing protein 1